MDREPSNESLKFKMSNVTEYNAHAVHTQQKQQSEPLQVTKRIEMIKRTIFSMRNCYSHNFTME